MRAKDQSYFLHAVDRSTARAALMPLGELDKREVRERARRAGLPVFDKPDSTGICFIGERPFREFLGTFLAQEPGPIESPEGERLGTHQGLAFYTLGQRGGLQIGGRRGHAEEPWYVAVKDSARNTLVVVQGHDHPLLSSARAHTERDALARAARRAARFRCSGEGALPAGATSSRLLRARRTARRSIAFDQPQRAVTPGQYAVAYDGDRCLGRRGDRAHRSVAASRCDRRRGEP